MNDTMQLMPSNDRKALEVTRAILSYACEELRDLSRPQPELAAAIGAALQLSSAILGAGHDDDTGAARRSSFE